MLLKKNHLKGNLHWPALLKPLMGEVNKIDYLLTKVLVKWWDILGHKALEVVLEAGQIGKHKDLSKFGKKLWCLDN